MDNMQRPSLILCVVPLIALGAVVAQAQDAPLVAPPAPPTSGVFIDGQVYPTNLPAMGTDKAGVLGLRATDIPRYTQTGPVPNPAPARRSVLPPVPHDPQLPTIWTIGDSTVRCGVNATGDDRPGQWGWGTPFVGYFDPQKVNVVNRAVGGTTTASFYAIWWKDLIERVKKGDVVLIQFGTNSGRGELPGIGEEIQEAAGRDGQPVTNHTFGWYLRKFIAEIRAKEATPVICSLIPRNSRGPDGKIQRSATRQAGWARDVAAAEKAGFIDLNELIARKYDALDTEAVNALFAGSPHTSWAGAIVNAETVISGLKALKTDPVAPYYLPQVKDIAPAPDLSQPAPQPAATTAR
jgi:lysophospholipase L1-like esterase